MGEINLTSEQREDIFFDVTAIMLGLDIKLPDTQKAIRRSWLQNGAPNFKIDDDVCFYRIVPHDELYIRQRDTWYEHIPHSPNLNQITESTRAHSVSWVFYGPHSQDRAEVIRSRVLDDDVRAFLRKHHIAPIADIPSPIRIPESINSQWWERCDMTVCFYELVRLEREVGTIESVDIRTATEKGETH